MDVCILVFVSASVTFPITCLCRVCSTVSSGLNSLAAVVLQDMVKAFCYPNMSEHTSTNVSKGIGMSNCFICF